MLLGAASDACKVVEISLARRLNKEVSDNLLTLLDPCYYSADLFKQCDQIGEQRHWLILINNKMRFEVIEEYADNDLFIEMPVSPQARKQNLELSEI